MDARQIEAICNYFCGNEMRELKKICDPIILRKGVPRMEWDDLYSDAMKVLLESAKTYDDKNKNGCSFKTYLTHNIENSYWEWTRDRRRGKRCNLLRDKNGRIVRDEEGNPTILADISIEALKEEGIEVSDLAVFGDGIENPLSETMEILFDGRVVKFMESLSDTQRKILLMKMDEVPVNAIKRTLCITDSEYIDAMKAIKENRLICLFNKNRSAHIGRAERRGKMVKTVQINEDDIIMDLDTTDNHTTDVRSIESLLKDKSDGELDCNYISQRDPLQWSEEQADKYLSRVLNNQPIPEIVICETDKSLYGEKVSYLVEGLQRISYAEEFRENRMPVKAKGAEFTKIKYKKYEYDAEGRIVKDENGRAKYTIDVFDITGKYYRDLPEFLQKRFNNYLITITRFFNCSYEMIDYHIRNYNNHVGMTKSHYGITSISNRTSSKIKEISRNHPFFQNHVKYTNKARKRGVLEEMVVRTIMAMFFREDWKKESVEAMRYVDQKATKEQYARLISNLDRLAAVADKSVKNMFQATNIHIWLAVFDRFTNYHVEDKLFVEFMRTFESRLHGKKIHGRSYDEVNNRNTKDKSTVKNKMDVLVDLMEEFLETQEIDEGDIG